MKLVSVVIPFYSGKKWLIEALDSVISQTYSNYEIILVNDGSNENIDDVLSNYQGNIRYIYTENRGAGAARNLGIDVAKGDYIAFLDSDDLWPSNKLSTQVSFLENNPSYAWSISSYKVFDDTTRRFLRSVNCSSLKGNVFPKIMYSSSIATPTVMIRTSLLKNNNLGFEEKLKYGEDSCLWIKLAILSPLGCINEDLAYVRWRGSNAASNIKEQIASRPNVYNALKSDDLFLENEHHIHKIALILIKYCSFILKYIENDKFYSNNFISSILYFPARLLFKLLSMVV